MSIFQKLAQNWGSPMVARAEVSRMTGGVLHPRTMANLDAKGEGPGKYMIGGRVFYDVDQLVAWMEKRARSIEPRTTGNLKERKYA